MASDMTFVTVVESGGIELSAMKLVRSLRKWGGQCADNRFVFVKPRFGPPLMRETRKEMLSLGVEFIRTPAHPKYAWYNFLNKPLAIAAAARWPTVTEQLCWIDADFLVLGDLGPVALRADEDIALCAPDLNLGTRKDGDRFNAYWRHFCRVLDLPFEQLGKVFVHREQVHAHTYFNGGLMNFRRSSGFAETYLSDTIAALEARFRSSTEGIFMHEQMTIGVTCRKLGLRVREPPWIYNFNPKDALRDPETARNAVLLHYHGMMWPEKFAQMQAFFAGYHPAKSLAIDADGPLCSRQVPSAWRLLSRVLKSSRARKANRYLRSCDCVPTPETDQPLSSTPER